MADLPARVGSRPAILSDSSTSTTMPHADSAPKPLLNLLLMIVAQSREGMTLAEIKGALSPTPPERVLLKAVGALVDSGRLAREGADAEARYRVVRPTAAPQPAASDGGHAATAGGPQFATETPAQTPTPPPPSTTAPAIPEQERGSGGRPAEAASSPPEEERKATEGVAEIFDATITTIVGARMSASTSTMLFQRAVAERIPAPERRTCLVLLKAKLDQFSVKDAARYEIDPETYRGWRAAHEGTVGAALVPDDTGSGETEDVTPPPSTPAPAPVEAGAPAATPPKRHRSHPSTSSPAASPSPDAEVGTSPIAQGGSWQDRRGVGREADVLALLGQLLQRVVQPGQSDVYLKRVFVSGLGVVVSLVLIYVFDSPGWGYVILPLAAAPGLMVGGRKPNSQEPVYKSDTTATLSEKYQVPGIKYQERAPSTLPASTVGRDLRIPPGGASERPPTPSTLSRAFSFLLSPFSRGRRLPAACVLVLLVIAALVIAIRGSSHPTMSSLEQHLTASVTPLPVRVTELRTTFASPTSLDCVVRFSAVLETTAPLYKPAPEALASLGGPDASAVEAAAVLLRGPLGPRIRAAIATAEPTPALSSIVIVSPTTPAGTRLPYAASLVATRASRGWFLGPVDRPLDRSRLVGEPKPPGAFAVDIPSDVDALKRLVAQHAAYAAQVRRVADSLTVELARERQGRAETFVQLLRPGTLFTGAVVHPSRTESHKILLEITDYSPASGRISALLRNDGGWTDARAFQGDTLLDPDAERLTATLRTRAEQRLPESGPLLDQHGELTFILDLRLDGTLVATASGWNVQLTRPSPADAVQLKADLMRGLATSLAATRPGTLYHGTAIPRQGAGAEPLLLRFVEQDPTGSILVAELESSTTEGWRRTFRGMIVDNTYRAGSTPIRLRSADQDRVVLANRRSVLGYQTHDDSLALALRPDGNRLLGETDLFTFRFELADASWVQDQEAARAERARVFMSLVRTGAAYDGLAREPGGRISRVRLRFEEVQPADASLLVNLESRDQPGIHHRLSGTFDPGSGKVALASTGSGKTSTTGTLGLPLFTRAGAYQVTLTVTPNQITGTLAQDNWTLTFVTEGKEQVSGTKGRDSEQGDAAPGAGTATSAPDLPAFPTATGAYILVSDAWQPLPVASAERTQQQTRQRVNTFLGALQGVKDLAAGRVPDLKPAAGALVLNTVEAPPTAPAGAPVTIVYVGTLELPPAAAQVKGAVAYPVMEMAATQLGRDGRRLAPLVQVIPGVLGFGASRLSATVEQPRPGVTLLRSTGPVAPGRYAIACGSRTYEVDVK